MHIRKRPQPSPRYVAYAAVSIDGKISVDTTKMPDWTSAEDWTLFQKELGKADAVVVGRGTFDAAKAYIEKRRAYVLSKKYAELHTEGTVTFVDPARHDLRALFAGYKTVAIVGGAECYQTMLTLGLLDELYVTIEPVIFGRGRELFFGGVEDVACTLRSVKKLNRRGTLVLRYEILKLV